MGVEAVEFAASVGLELDPWQADVMIDACRVDRFGKWVAMEAGLNVARQNGKGGILEARLLAGLFLWDEGLLTYSAHMFDTSLEMSRRLEAIIEGSEELSAKVKRFARGHGDEGVELLDKRRIRFRTRTRGGGRGFSGSTMVLDEAMFLPQFAHGALMPTASAQPNPQLWYVGSAVDQDVHEHGLVFTGIRNRGIAGDDPRLYYAEWSLEYDHPMSVPEDVLDDPAAWAEANPAFGVRIDVDFTQAERNSFDTRTFAVERLGVGDYPSLDADSGQVIPLATWDALTDEASEIVGPVALAFDVSPDRRASLAAAGRRVDDRFHVEVIRNRTGTGWLVEDILGITGRNDDVVRVVCAGDGPARGFVAKLEAAGVTVETFDGVAHAGACGHLLDVIEQDELRHLGSDEMRRALRGAKTRPLGDAWAWSRKHSSVDISPLVASTLAVAAAAAPLEEPEPTTWRAV